MTSLKQNEANRRNALKSTGPRTEEGKQNASRNAVRHGLAAETVIETLENINDYNAFEQVVAADYEAETAVERELILRLASLLWRLRRATSIETSLMSMDHDPPPPREAGRDLKPRANTAGAALFLLRKRCPDGVVNEPSNNRDANGQACEDDPNHDVDRQAVLDVQSDIARRFLRVANLDHAVFDRLSRYEMTLWRQVRQTLFTLEAMRWRSLTPRRPSQRLWEPRIDPPHD